MEEFVTAAAAVEEGDDDVLLKCSIVLLGELMGVIVLLGFVLIIFLLSSFLLISVVLSSFCVSLVTFDWTVVVDDDDGDVDVLSVEDF